MRKNPFSRIINHKILHKIGKQWVVLSASLLILLSGMTVATHASTVKISNDQPKVTRVAQPKTNVTNQAQQLHRKLLRNSAKPINKSSSVNNQSLDQILRSNHHIKPNQIAKQIMTFYRGRHNRARKIRYRRPVRKQRARKHYVRHYRKRRVARKRRVRPAKRYVSHKKNSFHETFYRRPWKTYLSEAKGHHDYAFNNGELKNLKNNNSDSYSNDYSDLYDQSPERIKVYGRTNVNGQEFYNAYLPTEGNKYWVLANEVSHNRKHRYNRNKLTGFLNHEDKQFLHKYYDAESLHKIHDLRSQYNYLMKYENSSDTSDLDDFREHVIDWINFWRSDIYKLSPVQENSDYDDKAQSHAETQSDPEDMDWGSTNPTNIVSDYVTDQNDTDNSDEPGHRYSVLNPEADQVGTGQSGDVNGLFFDWGEDNDHNSDSQVEYPNVGPFPYSDTTKAQYWSFHAPNLRNESEVSVYVHDVTDHNKNVPLSHVTFRGNNVAYKVNNKNRLKNGHHYYVQIYVPGDGSQPTYWYNTVFFNLDPGTKAN